MCLALARFVALSASLGLCIACSNNPAAPADAGSPPPRDGGPSTDGGSAGDGGQAVRDGGSFDAGLPCNQQSLGQTSCGVDGGLGCPRGQVCVDDACGDLSGPRPGPRSDASMVYDPLRNRILLFGGDTRGTVNGIEQPLFTNETWAFDMATQQWEKLALPGPPEARGGYAAARGGRAWYIFGGRSGSFGTLRLHNDVWAYDLDNDAWTEVTPDLPKDTNPNVPDPRHRTHAAYDPTGNRLLVFGGNSDADHFAAQVHNDLWAFDLVGHSWSEVAKSSPWPLARSDFAADLDETNRRFYIFGGARDPQTLSDELWRFNIASSTWESFPPTGAPAPPEFARFGGQIAYVPTEDAVYLMGGEDATAIGRRNDLWRFELGTRSWISVVAGETELRSPICGIPERREEHGWLFLPPEARLLLFGGQSDCGLLDDTWYYDLTAKQWSNPFPATVGETCARVAPACFDLCPGP
jgi:hypothetical protein